MIEYRYNIWIFLIIILNSILALSGTLEEIMDIDIEVESRNEDLRRLENNIDKLNQELENYKEELKKNERLLLKKKNEVRYFLMELYSIAHNLSLISFFGTEDPIEIIKKFSFWKKIINRSSSELSKISDSIKELEATIKKLNDRLKARENTISLISNYKKVLLIKKEMRGKLVANTKKSEVAKEYAIVTSNLLLSLKKECGSRLVPQLPSLLFNSIDGSISLNPFYPNLLLVRFGKKTEIKAIDNGRVIFKDWYPGYGKLLVIKHNKGCSLYGHLSSLNVELEQYVKKGEVLGYSGNSGALLEASELLLFGVIR